MAVLVTGAAGHIGSNIARTLIEQGEKVVGFDVATPPAYSVLHPLTGKFPFVLGSILDLAKLLNTMKEHKVDSIIHLAAIMTGASQRPLETIKINVEGTANILESGRILGLRRIVSTSSFAAAGAHGKDQSRLIPETEYGIPVNHGDKNAPYASTKLMCEELTCFYRERCGVDAAIIRPARVWGPGRHAGRGGGIAIEALLEKVFAKEPTSVPSGRDTRIDLTYVKDEAAGFILAYKAPKLENWLFNISSGRLYSIGEIADAINKAIPDVPLKVGPGEWLGISSSEPHTGPARPASDITRARKELGYEPKFADLSKAIPDYRAWMESKKY